MRNVIALFYFVGSENPCIYSVPNRKQSYEKVFAAVHVLEFVLLAIVYHEIGISSESIKSCKTSVQFQPFDEFVKVLTQNIRNEST